MYLFKVKIKDSKIEGKGVFTLENISKGTIVWKFNPDIDKSMTQKEYNKLDKDGKEELEKVGYLSPSSGLWIYPSENDLARYTNHSLKNNNLSVIFDKAISPEAIFVANRDILKGEELLNNYLEFDEFIKNTKPTWSQTK